MMRHASNEFSNRPFLNPAEDTPWRLDRPAHSVWRERLIAGVISGTVVVCWFVLFDTLTARGPLQLAQRIGGALAQLVIGGPSIPLATSLVFFCVFHYGVWILNASVVLGVIHRARKHPSIVVLTAIVILILYMPLLAMSTMFVSLGWGHGSWIRFIVGTLLGEITAIVLACRAHPGLFSYELKHIDDDED
jgi:hypothetical protein